MKSVMINKFQDVPDIDVPRSKFDRSCGYKTTLNSGYLYPVFYDEVLPGDTKRLNTTFFGRLATPLTPFMDNIFLDYHLWFVPRRLIWNNWQKFMGEQVNKDDSIDFILPECKAPKGGFPRYGLADYFGVPPAVEGISMDAGYLRSYNIVWNEWYRSEQLQDSVEVPLDDGPDDYSKYNLLKRGKHFDYFTSCLPSPQKGPGVELPLGTTAPVVGNGLALGLTNGTNNYGMTFYNSNQLGVLDAFQGVYGSKVGSSASGSQPGSGNHAIGLTKDGSKSGLVVDLSNATATTINTLRQAIAKQQFLERDARYGTRYIELIYSHFGVHSPDARLQRPEYLGGGTTRLNINQIAQTSETTETSPQGNLTAYGTLASTGNGFTRSFTEHGIIIGLVSIRADLNYQQGIDRTFSRKSRYDFYWPSFAHLGEQAVLNKEIYAQGTEADEDVFGYNERYAEYRYKPSLITGKFRSSDPQTLDSWHLAQNFVNLPTLSSQFIEENPPIKRVIAVQDEPEFLLDCYHDFEDIREIPVYGVPGLMRL